MIESITLHTTILSAAEHSHTLDIVQVPCAATPAMPIHIHGGHCLKKDEKSPRPIHQPRISKPPATNSPAQNSVPKPEVSKCRASHAVHSQSSPNQKHNHRRLQQHRSSSPQATATNPYDQISHRMLHCTKSHVAKTAE